jgi:hypothetical protein
VKMKGRRQPGFRIVRNHAGMWCWVYGVLGGARQN